MKTAIQHVNPDGLMKSPAFSQAVVTQGKGKTVYIGGQNAVNVKGEVVGDDIAAQTKQVMHNLQLALEACGADFSDVVRMNVYLLQGQDAAAAFQHAQPFLSTPPPAVTGLFVSGLANPAFLVEVEAIAFVSL
jgi:enamine deaminase RidA (YjgF/YER057c/UK114 family)